MQQSSFRFYQPGNNPSWTVPVIDIKNFLLTGRSVALLSTGEEVKSENLTYTITNPRFVFQDAQELTELYLATGSGNLNDLVSFRPERIVLQQIIALVIMKFQLTPQTQEESLALEHREMLQRAIIQVHEQIKARSDLTEMISQLYNERHEIHSIITALVHHESPSNIELFLLNSCTEAIEKATASIKRESLGDYVPGYTTEKAIIMLATNMIYKQIANQKISRLVNSHIDERIQAGEFTPFETPSPEQRNLFILVGGAASGKGSACASLRYSAEQDSIPWVNISKGGSDNFKKLLESEDTLPEIADQLVANESSYITWSIVKNMQLEAAEQSQAPHIFSEQLSVSANDDMIDLGLKNNGVVKIIVVSTKVEEAIERAYNRGKEIGRYIPSSTILAGHKNSTQSLPHCLANFAGKNVEVLFLDNNGPKGSKPEVFATVDCLNNVMVILNKEKFEEFIKKTAINILSHQNDNVPLSPK